MSIPELGKGAQDKKRQPQHNKKEVLFKNLITNHTTCYYVRGLIMMCHQFSVLCQMIINVVPIV